MTNQCIKCDNEVEDFFDLCTDCSKDAYADNIFWICCDALITEPVINRFREQSETMLTIGDGTDEILFLEGKTVEEEIENFEPESEKEYNKVQKKMNSILGEMGVSKEFDEENYIFSKKDVKIFSELFYKLEKMEHEFTDTEGLSSLYLRFGNLFFYDAIKSDVGNFEPDFRKKIVNDLLKESEGFFTLAVRSDENNHTALKNMGKLKLKKSENALEYLEKSLKLSEDDETKRLLIESLIRSNKLEEAEEKLDQFFDEDIPIIKGDIAKMKGGWGRAIQFYEESDEEEALIKKAELFLANERYEKALESYSEYLEEHENDHRALKGKAECLLELDEPEEASDFIQKSISLDAHDDIKWIILGKIHEINENMDESKAAYQNALKLNPENKDAKKRLKGL